jgi:hypothetical protein
MLFVLFKFSNTAYQKQVVIAGDDIEDDVEQELEQKNFIILNFGFYT